MDNQDLYNQISQMNETMTQALEQLQEINTVLNRNLEGMNRNLDQINSNTSQLDRETEQIEEDTRG